MVRLLPPAVETDAAMPAMGPEDAERLSESQSLARDKIVPLAPEHSGRVQRMTARMREGDEAAFTEFYESYCDRLYRYLLLLTRGNETISRDLLQATMTKVMQSMREFWDEQHLWNWLASIARNSFIDSLRRTQRAPEIIPLLPEDTPEVPASGPDDSERMLFEALDRALVELDCEERALIQAFYIKGGSYKSIAEQRDATPKAVESKLARVRQKLRAALLHKLRYEND